jgi:hypothetical protein
MAANAEEVVLALPANVANARNMKSTVLQASVNAVRTGPRGAAYLAKLAPAHKDALLTAIAGTWIPIDVAAAHYEACDAAGFTQDDAFANGGKTFDIAGHVIFGTVLKMARASGVTPWTLLEQLQRFWERGYDGGGIAVSKLGPKEARVNVVRQKLFESPYYRGALRGLLGAALGLFCTRVYVVERPGQRAFASIHLRVQWA